MILLKEPFVYLLLQLMCIPWRYRKLCFQRSWKLFRQSNFVIVF